MPLYDILNEFQKGHSHIAVVYKDLNEKKDTSKKGKESEQLELRIAVESTEAVLRHHQIKVRI